MRRALNANKYINRPSTDKNTRDNILFCVIRSIRLFAKDASGIRWKKKMFAFRKLTKLKIAVDRVFDSC